MNAVEFHGEAASRIAAFPYMVNPFQWAGVAETSTAYVSMHVDSLRPEVDASNNAQSYYKPEATAAASNAALPSAGAAAQAARNSHLGRAYVEWARFPLVEAEHLNPTGTGDIVRFSDVRFMYPESHRRVLEAWVLLDSHLRVEDEGFETPKGER